MGSTCVACSNEGAAHRLRVGPMPRGLCPWRWFQVVPYWFRELVPAKWFPLRGGNRNHVRGSALRTGTARWAVYPLRVASRRPAMAPAVGWWRMARGFVAASF